MPWMICCHIPCYEKLLMKTYDMPLKNYCWPNICTILKNVKCEFRQSCKHEVATVNDEINAEKFTMIVLLPDHSP